MKILKIIMLIFLSFPGWSQHSPITLSQAIDLAVKNNRNLRAATLETESQRQLKKTSLDLPKTEITLLYGQYNSDVKNDNNITVSQAIPFTVFGSQRAVNRAIFASRELKTAATANDLIYQVKQTYYKLVYTQAYQQLLIQQDSLYERFLTSASLRHKTGETNLLEKTAAEMQRNEMINQLRKNESEIMVLRIQLKILLGSETLPHIVDSDLTSLVATDTASAIENPFLGYVRQEVEVARSQKKLEIAKVVPELRIGFFTQTLIGTPNESGPIATRHDRFTGIQVGLAIPLWFAPHHGRIKAAELNHQASQNSYEHFQMFLEGQLQQATQEYLKNKNSLDYYTTSALPNASLILKQSQASFREGEISYAEFLLGLRNALTIKERYLQTLNDYNQSIITIEYLSGNNK